MTATAPKPCKTRVFVRRDVYGRFYSCLIYLPRENYNTDVRLKIQDILKRHLHGVSAEFTVQLSDAVLARMHMLVRSAPRDQPHWTVRAASRKPRSRDPLSPRKIFAGFQL